METKAHRERCLRSLPKTADGWRIHVGMTVFVWVEESDAPFGRPHGLRRGQVISIDGCGYDVQIDGWEGDWFSPGQAHTFARRKNAEANGREQG